MSAEMSRGKGLTQIRNFVRKNSNTNVMVLNLPNRQDLEATSCVNQEVKDFNRKLCKHMKFFDYASSVEVKFDRDHYIRHGLHLNIKGKEHSAKLLMTAVKGIFNKSKMIPISVNWNEMQEVIQTKSTGKIEDQDGCQGAMDLPTQSHEKTAVPLNRKDV
jgi:hypothetical protein